jgi:hypothetical protein
VDNPRPGTRRTGRLPDLLGQNPAPAAADVPLVNLTDGGGVPMPAPASAPPSLRSDERGLPSIPWLVAAALLVGVVAFFLWRSRRGSTALASGPNFDLFTAPEPAVAAPEITPPPTAVPKLQTPVPDGVVSTKLRPWLELSCRPLRCILGEEQLTIEFELELYNSGSAAAEGVLVEARLFNAGSAQDQSLGQFFANPLAQGERSLVIAPLNRLAIKSEVVAPREQLQAYQLADKHVFVPVIAFNALYRWGRGEGQTSVSYLLGRDTGGEKLGPLRFDPGTRVFRSIAGRLLPNGLRK